MLRLLRPASLLALLSLSLLMPAHRATAQSFSATAPHLTVSLLVPPAEIYPGQTFTAGLDFRMEEHWHVYWINAGDSGEPPAITWTLPDRRHGRCRCSSPLPRGCLSAR